MIFTRIRKNRYHDSINLTILTKAVNTTEGVNKAQVMLGTDANKELFKEADLYNDDVKKASPNDMVVAIEAEDEAVMDQVMEKVEDYLKTTSVPESTDDLITVTSWEDALKALPNANIAFVSIAGLEAVKEVEKALDHNLHVFVFGGDISVENEVRLKNKAHEKGLLLMGPNGHVGMLSSVPLGLMDVMRPGNIGIVGAFDSGVQEITSNINHLDGGVMHVINTGERDVTEKVGATTMIDALVAFENHDATDVLVIVSRLPAPKVREKIISLLQSLSKPVVVVFLGEKITAHKGNIYQASTFEESAQIAVALALGDEIKEISKTFMEYTGKTQEIPTESSAIHDLLTSKPRIVNIGFSDFRSKVNEFGGEIVHIEDK